jgi:beta-galactosidase/beta-glucuronidase
MYPSPHDKESKNRLASARCHSQPLRFYHHCDKLGMLVWQDMPNGSDHSPQFEKELKGMIDAARAHPSIVMWVLFNEGWGQHEAARHADWTVGQPIEWKTDIDCFVSSQ